jgi:hypothetical protein
MADEDRRLLCEDFDCWQADVAFKAPLVRKQLPGLLVRSILGAFEITLTNKSKRSLTLHAKPGLFGESGERQGSGGSLATESWQCVSHPNEFATLRPGESIRWSTLQRLYLGENDQTHLTFRLYFQERGKMGLGWRGQVATPWIAVKKENIRDE